MPLDCAYVAFKVSLHEAATDPCQFCRIRFNCFVFGRDSTCDLLLSGIPVFANEKDSVGETFKYLYIHRPISCAEVIDVFTEKWGAWTATAVSPALRA